MRGDDKVRFAVIGLGKIAQGSVLPAFARAGGRCKLVALVSSQRDKRVELGRQYGAEFTGDYDELEDVLHAARADAAYIALPNTYHRAFTERCARAKVHVLCEKPMAMNAADAQAMIDACRRSRVELMIAYRLHFEAANLRAMEIAKSGKLGELRHFSALFTQQTHPGDIRTQGDVGGGALYDLGVYCLNAARYIFRAEPEEVFGMQTAGHDRRFEGVDEATTAVLRFPGDRLAQFSVSQGAARVDQYRIVGTEGELLVEPAFTYRHPRHHRLSVGGKTAEQAFQVVDQFAPQLAHFADCIIDGNTPEPSGEEGLADVRVLEAIARSAYANTPVRLGRFTPERRPGSERAPSRRAA